MTTRYTVELNNYLQGQGNVQSLSWVEASSGPSHAKVWTMTCKISGETKGTASATQKAVAKEEAAKQALKALGVDV
ncbi:hypothetical protein JAAARDRAFT_188661 [Jaapia argillacea MUCL 33604]|uniref:DRBM domain-containing protein n=1 Tax=Jaapia argillacea MUCL 33604 TaxID=933084 RepID=A0A067Q7L6_9AGAM|nr:hypothetical protein JAAARDRAFT_188661 [Jaapia argillacea MUCL 33604]